MMQNPQPRRSDPFAVTLFFLAYVGILAIVFAPEGTFQSAPTIASSQP